MLHVDDDGFVRAPAGLVYRRLTDIGAWPSWWPGVDVSRLDDAAGGEAWAVQLAASRWRALRVGLRPHTWRHDAGFAVSLTGDLAGDGEFWLEPVAGGTVLHHVLAATPRGSGLRTFATYRTVLRRGMWAFKDTLQSEVRATIGLRP